MMKHAQEGLLNLDVDDLFCFSLLLPFDGWWCLLFCAAIDSTDVDVAAAAVILDIDALSAAADILCAAFTEDNGVYMADSGEL